MNEKIVNQILTYLDQLGKALSSGAKESFAIIVRQQVSLGIVDSFMCLIIMAALTWIAIACLKGYRNYKPKQYGDDGIQGAFIAGIVVPSLFNVLFLFCLTRSILHILNPAFFAIQYILGTITGNN